MADDTTEPLEAEIVRCVGCGAERDLELRPYGDRTIALCPTCRDTAELLKALGRRVGWTVLQRFRAAFSRGDV